MSSVGLLTVVCIFVSVWAIQEVRTHIPASSRGRRRNILICVLSILLLWQSIKAERSDSVGCVLLPLEYLVGLIDLKNSSDHLPSVCEEHCENAGLHTTNLVSIQNGTCSCFSIPSGTQIKQAPHGCCRHINAGNSIDMNYTLNFFESFGNVTINSSPNMMEKDCQWFIENGYVDASQLSTAAPDTEKKHSPEDVLSIDATWVKNNVSVGSKTLMPYMSKVLGFVAISIVILFVIVAGIYIYKQ